MKTIFISFKEKKRKKDYLQAICRKLKLNVGKLNDIGKVHCTLHAADKWMINVKNYAVWENYSYEVCGFVVAS